MSGIADQINERLNLADGILAKLNSYVEPSRVRSSSRVLSVDFTAHSPSTEVNAILVELNQWQFVTKELLIKAFGEDSRFTKLFERTIMDPKMGFNYKEELTNETNNGVSALKSILECIEVAGPPFPSQRLSSPNKAPIVFISHSYKDIAFVEALVDLLEGIGLDENTLFCSSIPGYWINLGKDIYKALLSLFTDRSLYVIFVQSPNFYNSPVSLNEMGAAWALKTNYCSILTHEMEFSAMTAVVNSHEVAIKVNNADAKPRLTELKNSILEFLGKPSISDIFWERKRDKFLQAVDPSYSDSSSSHSITEEYQQLMIEKMKHEKEELLKAIIRGNIYPASQKGSRHLRIFNAGKFTAKNIRIEWLNEDETVILSKPFETIEDLSPQNNRDYRLLLVYGHPETMRLRYTWDDDFKKDNTFEEGLQL